MTEIYILVKSNINAEISIFLSKIYRNRNFFKGYMVIFFKSSAKRTP